MPLVLLIGGARSGKSRFALELAKQQASPVVFVATAEAGDAEMERRIAQHRRERPPSWQTIEEPLRLLATIEAIAPRSCVIVDCLTLWTANALAAHGAGETVREVDAAATASARRAGLTIVVTNEVGLGLVPDNPLGRSYRDLLGHANTIWATAADRVLFLVAGQALPLRRADQLTDVLL